MYIDFWLCIVLHLLLANIVFFRSNTSVCVIYKVWYLYWISFIAACESSVEVGCIVLLYKKLCCRRGRVMLRVCIASIQNVKCSLLLLVVSALDIPLRTIKFFSVLFSSAYSSMLQAVTNKHSLVRRRLCDLHCMVVGNCFCHFVLCSYSNRSIASGAWPTASYTQLRRR